MNIHIFNLRWKECQWWTSEDGWARTLPWGSLAVMSWTWENWPPIIITNFPLKFINFSLTRTYLWNVAMIQNTLTSGIQVFGWHLLQRCDEIQSLVVLVKPKLVTNEQTVLLEVLPATASITSLMIGSYRNELWKKSESYINTQEIKEVFRDFMRVIIIY